jgi:hypothetical protein
MSDNRLAADLFTARKRSLGESDRIPLSAMTPRIQRQYHRFAQELQQLLDRGSTEPAAVLDEGKLAGLRIVLNDPDVPDKVRVKVCNVLGIELCL